MYHMSHVYHSDCLLLQRHLLIHVHSYSIRNGQEMEAALMSTN